HFRAQRRGTAGVSCRRRHRAAGRARAALSAGEDAMSLAAHGIALRVPGRPLVEDLSFELAPGARAALLGRNGAGKSTLLHTLAGLRPCQAGRVTLDGEDVHRMRRTAAALRIGVLL